MKFWGKRRRYSKQSADMQRNTILDRLVPKKFRFPFQKNKAEMLMARKKILEMRKQDFAKAKRIRIKYPVRHRPVLIGPGYPPFALIYANMDVARGERKRQVLERNREGIPKLYEPLKTELPHPVPDSVFYEYCQRLGIENYDFNKQFKEPKHSLDLTAFDLYWEDIRIEIGVIVKELKHLPLYAKIPLEILSALDKAIHSISRSCYYSPTHSHKKSEEIVHLLVWFLNRRNIPIAFQIKVLQALSNIVYSSHIFKMELVHCKGVIVLNRLMQVGLVICGLLASWACYTLCQAAINCPEIIALLRRIPDFDETIGELSFGMYWYYFPCNFANVLQGLVYGPGGVANSLEVFEFL